jgi:dCTP deaminase
MEVSEYFFQLDRIKLQIQFALNIIYDLQSRLSHEMDTGDFISDTPRNLSELIYGISTIIESHLKWKYYPKINTLKITCNEQKDSEFKNGLQELQTNVIQATRLAAHLVENIKYLNGSTAYLTPWRIAGQLERFIRKISPNSRMIISPRWKYNYSFTPISSKLIGGKKVLDVYGDPRPLHNGFKVDSSFDSAFSELLENHPYYFCLSFPPNSSEDTLNFALWFHELGHLAARKRLPNGKQTDQHIVEGMEFRHDAEGIKTINSLFTENSNDKQGLSDQEYVFKVIRKIQQTYDGWGKEIIADILSIKFGGPASLFSLFRFISCIEPAERLYQNDKEYPPFAVRAWILVRAYSDWEKENHDWIKGLPNNIKLIYQEEVELCNNLSKSAFDDYRQILQKRAKGMSIALVDLLALDCLEDFYIKYTEEISKMGDLHESFINSNDLNELPSMIDDLKHGLPPRFKSQDVEKNFSYYDNGKSLAVFINAGWLLWITTDNEWPIEGVKFIDNQSTIYKEINRLVSKSVEIAEAEKWYFEHNHKYPTAQIHRDEKMISTINSKNIQSVSGPLGKHELVSRLCTNFHVLPMLDWDKQVDNASIDIRLGNEFIVTKLPVITKLDPAELGLLTSTEEFQSKIYIPFGRPFVLHPRQLVLGSTLEYISLPVDLMGVVLGRSSWGRLGLIIATASKIDPGFKGAITLELTNLGNVPIYLYPGSRIGQIVIDKIIM